MVVTAGAVLISETGGILRTSLKKTTNSVRHVVFFIQHGVGKELSLNRHPVNMTFRPAAFCTCAAIAS